MVLYFLRPRIVPFEQRSTGPTGAQRINLVRATSAGLSESEEEWNLGRFFPTANRLLTKGTSRSTLFSIFMFRLCRP